MKRSSTAVNPLVVALRRKLKAQGWTARRLATELDVGEATVKRWLVGRGLSLERFEALARLVGTSAMELAREADQPPSDLAQELTLAQERELSSDAFLPFVFMTLLGGITPAEIARDFSVPDSVMEAVLTRLARLALIDRLPGGRVRPLVDRNILWRKSPMRTLFEERMKSQFLAMDFADPDAVYFSEVIKLSAAGAARLAEMNERYRRDVHVLAETDARQALLPRKWYAMLSAIRAMETATVQQGWQE